MDARQNLLLGVVAVSLGLTASRVAQPKQLTPAVHRTTADVDKAASRCNERLVTREPPGFIRWFRPGPGARPRVLAVVPSNMLFARHTMAQWAEMTGFACTVTTFKQWEHRNQAGVARDGKPYAALFLVTSSFDNFIGHHPAVLREVKAGLSVLAVCGQSQPTSVESRGHVLYDGNSDALNDPTGMLGGVLPAVMAATGGRSRGHFGIHSIAHERIGRGNVYEIMFQGPYFYRNGLVPALDEIYLTRWCSDLSEHLFPGWWNYYYSLYATLLDNALGRPWTIWLGWPHRPRPIWGVASAAPGGVVVGCVRGVRGATVVRVTAWLVRRGGGLAVHLRAAVVTRARDTRGDRALRFHLPLGIPQGLYMLNVVCSGQNGATAGWFSEPINVRLPGNAGRITELAAKAHGGAGEHRADFTARCHIQTSGDETRVRAMLSDAWRRILWRRSLDLKASATGVTAVTFRGSLPAAIILGTWSRLTVETLHGFQILDRASTDMYFPPRFDARRNDYVVAAYVWAPLYYRDLLYPLLHEIGVNTINCWPPGAPDALAHGFMWTDGWGGVCENRSLIYGALDKYKMTRTDPAFHPLRKDDFYDAQWRGLLRGAVRAYADRVQSHPPLGYMFWDEMSLANPWQTRANPEAEPDRSRQCLDLYRRYLRTTYRSLASLNRQWTTSYRSWAAIVPPLTAEARKKKNFSSWVQFRLFMDSLFAGISQDFTEDGAHFLPETAAGQPNWTYINPFSGIDPSKIVPTRTGSQDYYDIWQRSFARPGAKMWNWSHYTYPKRGTRTQDLAMIREGLYARLFAGASGDMIYGLEEKPGHPSGFINPSMAATRRSQMLQKLLRPLVDGVGKAVMDSVPAKPTVAIVYSQASMDMAWLESSNATSFSWPIRHRWNDDSYMNWYRSNFGMRRLVENMGLAFRFVTEKQVDEGVLGKYKVLVLPMTIGIGARTRAQIYKWQRAGGIVLADDQVGSRDALGKPVGGRWLSDTFGITSRSLPNWKHQSVALKGAGFEMAGEQRLRVEAGCRVFGHYANHQPLVVVDRVRGGLGIMLNGVATYDRDLRDLLLRLLANKGVRPFAFATAAAAATQPLDGVEFYYARLGQGGVRLLGLVRHPNPGRRETLGLKQIGPTGGQSAKTIFVHLARRYRVYNVLRPCHVNVGRTVRLTMEPTDAALLALFPRKRAPRLTLTVLRSSDVGGRPPVVIVGLEPGSGADRRIVHLAVVAPDGGVMPGRGHNLTMTSRRRRFVVPLALNDPSGLYQVRATDVLTGKVAAAVVQHTQLVDLDSVAQTPGRR